MMPLTSLVKAASMIRKLFTKAVVATHLPHNPFAGEMLPLERLRLYQWVMRCRPKVVLEVGTGVGGSTFYISEALKSYGGQLYTCDPVRRPPQNFLDRFRGTLHYEPLKSCELIEKLRASNIRPDFVFFDGPEIPELALEDIQSLESDLEDGCLFAMHDWEQVGGVNPRIVSIKAQRVRPYLENSQHWTMLELLDGHNKNVWWTKGKFDSVGLCLFQFHRNPQAARVAA